MTDIQYLERPGKPKLAYRYTQASEDGRPLPCVLFCGGFRSDMEGTKAEFLEKQCVSRGQGYIRYDYSGHGSSDGKFEDGTIGGWLQDTLDIIDHIKPEKLVIVGSSMGGWIALLVVMQRPEMIAGMVGIAAAPDFTEDIYWNHMDRDLRELLEEQGYIEEPNEYSDEPYVFTKALIDDGRQHLLLGQENKNAAPITLIQGKKDEAVPWELTSRVEQTFTGEPVKTILIDDGDHRLSRPQDLEIIDQEIRKFSGA